MHNFFTLILAFVLGFVPIIDDTADFVNSQTTKNQTADEIALGHGRTALGAVTFGVSEGVFATATSQIVVSVPRTAYSVISHWCR